jgi:hypothetical protein
MHKYRAAPEGVKQPRAILIASMRLRAVLLSLLAAFIAWGVLHAQKPFQEYPGRQWENFPLPPDWQEPHDWIWARLRYRDFGGGFRRGSWTIDYPRCDRHILTGVRRLTRVDARSVEQVVDLDATGDAYNWPFLYAVEVGRWSLSDAEAAQLRDFLNRGGFLMVDDFHGTYEWDVFFESFRKVFPDREIVEIDNADQAFHVLYDLEQRFQVPGAQYTRSGRTYEQDGYDPGWKGVYDEKGRLMAVICHNMDLGDAMEWSDDPYFPEKFSSLAYRVTLNYIVYNLTH